jgi:hypothetical protein
MYTIQSLAPGDTIKLWGGPNGFSTLRIRSGENYDIAG